jgi:UDPglucose 6-dehydrogenase
LRIYDPQGRRHGEALLPGTTWCDSALEAAKTSHVLVVLTEWNEFRALDLEVLRGAMQGDALIDTRNVYRPEDARAAGFRYFGVGRGASLPAASNAALVAEPTTA